MKRNVSVWEIIAWVGLALLVVWIILKIFRVIESPLILEMTPIITLCLILGSLLADMKNTKTEIKDVKSEIRKMADSLIKLGQDFKQLKGEHEIIKKKKH